MNYPLILQDIDNKILSKNFIVNKTNFFIKSYKKFDIKIINQYETDLEGNEILVGISDDPLDNPMLYSVIENGIVNKNTEFYGVNANYSYTLYLGKTEKKIELEIFDTADINSDNLIKIIIDYKPSNVLLESQEHYKDFIYNYDLPTLDELLPAIIIEENKVDLIKRMLLDFAEIKREKGKLKSIEKFLYFIGFNDDNIKLFPEYITPSGKKTINPNKLVDKKTGYYHVHYDNFIIQDDKYTRKNLPNFKLNVINFDEFFDKLFYALTLANDYFTIPEQQMSFFGISNMVNSEQYLSITSNMTQVEYIDTIKFRNSINININNRTIIDSFPFVIVKDKKLINPNIKRSETKILIGDNPVINPDIYKIERDFTDNESVTDLTPEEQIQIKHVFGNVLDIEIIGVEVYFEFKIYKKDLELIQYKSKEYKLDNDIAREKIFIKKDGIYICEFKFKDFHGNTDKYFYELKLIESNIDFNIFSSNKINTTANILTQDIDSPIVVTNNTSQNKNLRLINSVNNTELQNDLKNYFDIVGNYDNVKLKGEKQFKLKNLNHNTIMKNLTETLNSDFIDNFYHVLAFKLLPGWYYNIDLPIDFDFNFYEEMLITLELDITNKETNAIEKYVLVGTYGISVDIDPYLHSLEIIKNNNSIRYNLQQILNKELPSQFDYSQVKLPLNFDFQINGLNMASVFPRLNLQTNESLKQGDIIVCRINEKLIISDTDLEWIVENAFTGEILTKQNQKTLKYRIEDNMIYNIILKLNIDNQFHQIVKKSIITSFV